MSLFDSVGDFFDDNWETLGTVAAVAAAPYTGGASLAAIPIIQGISSSEAKKEQAKLNAKNAREQGDIARADAFDQAADELEAFELQESQDRQTLRSSGLASSGVSASSAGAVLERNRVEAVERAQKIRDRGTAIRNRAYKNADEIIRSGKAQAKADIIGGVTQGIATGYSAYSQDKKISALEDRNTQRAAALKDT